MTAANKEAVFRAAAERWVFVHLDGRQSDVVLPPKLKDQWYVVLQISTSIPTMTRGLVIDADGVRCTLSFDRRPFHCVIPWEAVFGMVSSDGGIVTYAESMPTEFDGVRAAAQSQPAPRAKPALRLIKN